MKNTSGGPDWLEFLSSSFVRKSLRYGIVGCSGSGKTSLAIEFIKYHRNKMKMGHRLIIFDPAEEFLMGREVNTQAEFLDSARDKYSVTRFTSKKLWPQILPLIMEGGNCLLVIDEAHKVFPKSDKKMHPLAFDIAAEGRKERISVLWLTQRPSKLNLELSGNSAGIIIGRLMMKADADRVKEWGVKEIQEFHEFIAVFPGLHPFQIKSKAFK